MRWGQTRLGLSPGRRGVVVGLLLGIAIAVGLVTVWGEVVVSPRESEAGIAPEENPVRRAGALQPRRAQPWSNQEYAALFAELRQVLPDNVYWDWAAPTRDPGVLGRRQVRNQRMARQRAKVEANLADAGEIRAFYDEQWKDSMDYVEFFQELLARGGDELPEPDVGLAQRAIEIHQVRLGRIPQRIEEALARRAAYVDRKARWVAAGKPPGLDWDTSP